MKAIILAAGKGSRISDDIGPIPKSTLKINGIPIVRRTVEMLLNEGISVAVCTGYRHEIIEDALIGLNVVYYNNPFFDTTNNIASLWFAREFLGGDDCMILSADVIFEHNILTKLINAKGDLVMVTDSSRVQDGDYFFQINKDGLIVNYGPDLPLEIRDCEYVGLTYISRNSIDSFKNTMINMINSGETQCYYECVFFKYIGNDEIELEIMDVAGCSWREIDKIEDYKKAIEEFK